MLVEIGDKIISTLLFEKRFVCDLVACKGACCIEGDGGAPLNNEDIEKIEQNLSSIAAFLDYDALQKLNKTGFYTTDNNGEKATSLMDNGACIFVTKDKDCTSCAIEKANNMHDFQYKKPISCHLYPIRTKPFNDLIGLNVESWSICNSACVLGEKLNVKVYEFLKEPIERAFGADFYQELIAIDKELNA